MRSVAVTEGDKVEAQMRFGYAVSGYGVGDLVDHVDQVSDAEIDQLVNDYEDQYVLAADLRKGGARHNSVREAARIELGLRSFLTAGDFKAFTDTFEDLHGLVQLPGLPVQRLMADGYGFGGEGDWKTSALVRAMKVMSAGLDGGTSFMEDYTYHLSPSGQKVLGAHMLEICPSIAKGDVRLEVHPLGIGGKADPARLVFNSQTGAAINVSLMDMGNRFRHAGQRRRRGAAGRAAAQAAGRAGAVDSAAEPQDGGGGVDLRRRRASYRLQPVADGGAHRRLRGNGGHRVAEDRRRDRSCIEFKQELRWNDAYYLLKQRI